MTLAIELESRPQGILLRKTSETMNKTSIKFCRHALDARNKSLYRRIFPILPSGLFQTSPHTLSVVPYRVPFLFACRFIFEREDRSAFEFIYWSNLMFELCTTAPGICYREIDERD